MGSFRFLGEDFLEFDEIRAITAASLSHPLISRFTVKTVNDKNGKLILYSKSIRQNGKKVLYSIYDSIIKEMFVAPHR